jgi:hypothetical protein
MRSGYLTYIDQNLHKNFEYQEGCTTNAIYATAVAQTRWASYAMYTRFEHVSQSIEDFSQWIFALGCTLTHQG